MSSPKQSKSGIVNLLTSGGSNPRFVPPVLRDVGKLAAGVAAVNTTGSATGNPRNKCALQPGHSLMDWIRLGASGKDLTGVGSQAGQLAVTPSELAKHNKLTDAWLSIRGRVFNVTAYLPFHPGGPNELMKGAGKDATTLFDEIHSWVNYESILQKCLVGHLVPFSPSINAEDLFNSAADPVCSKTLSPETIIEVKSPESKKLPKIEIVSPTPKKNLEDDIDSSAQLPKVDWIQKMNEISIIFYTPPLENPLVEVYKVEDTIQISLCYSDRTFSNELVLLSETLWPCDIKVNYETGKIEFGFKKKEAGIWKSYGVLKQTCKVSGHFSARNKISYVISNKIQVAVNVFVLELDRQNDVRIVVPIANHVRVFTDSKDEISRSYTPLPACILSQLGPQKYSSDKIFLMVKRYQDGFLSKYICDASIGHILELSKPIHGGLKLADLEKKEIFLLLAAGTGITPMFSIIIFLLERRIRRSQSVRLIFCNRKMESVPFRKQFEELSVRDSRFSVEHILSEPDKDWQGKKGHMTKSILKDTIEEQLSESNYLKDNLSIFICGPIAFNELCLRLLSELNIQRQQIHVFEG